MPVPASTCEPAAFEALVFDVDGTLIDTLVPMHQAFNDTLAQAGLAAWPLAAMRTGLSVGLPALLAQALGPGRADLPMLTRDLQLHYLALVVSQAQPYPGAAELLLAARQAGRRLAVCSNAGGAVLDALFARWGWQSHFQAVVHADNAQALKPSPLPLWQALGGLGVAPARACLVGDSLLDAQCARAAGCAHLWFSAGYGDAAAGEGALHRSDSHAALADWLGLRA